MPVRQINILLGLVILMSWLSLTYFYYNGKDIRFLVVQGVGMLVLWSFFAGFTNGLLGDRVYSLFSNFLERLAFLLTGITILFVFAMGAGLLIYQVHKYLKTGIWIQYSVVDVLKSSDFVWARHPRDWFGIWKLLHRFPMFAFLILSSFIALWPYENWKRRYKP